MADKKKFEKPEMQVIKLNAKMHMLAGSCREYCDDDTFCYDGDAEF